MKVLENTSGKNQEVTKLNDNDFSGDFWQGKETSNFCESYDLTLLNPLNEQTVLQAIEARYHGGIFYSWAGLPLVAVNPFHNVSELYEKTMVEKYNRRTSLEVKELPPHIFAVGQKAFCDLKRDLETRNQSIVVSGESGAGKTWTTRSLMRFITDITHTRPEEVFEVNMIEQRILDSNPILEAFGNATTMRNENSSRFGKYIQLQFDRKYNVVGATINTYLLEKTRVVHQAEGEKNFHIFEQMETVRSKETSVSPSFYHFPALQVTREAMRNVGIDDQLQHEMFEVLRGILALCDVDFTSPTQTSGDTCSFQDFNKVSEACRLLGIEEGRLQQSFLSRRIMTGSTNEQFMKPCSIAECGERRDCMSKLIYSSLFHWIVDFINASIRAPEDSEYSFIGLLDIYGFENFDNNSLEQLCINYANEKLQQHFVYHFMKRQQDDYRKEGIEWSFQDFVDNRPCLDLIEGKMSIFSLMNEECRLKRDLDTHAFSCRLDSSLVENCHFARPRFKSKDHEFTIHHFADSVCYKVEGLLKKNKDFVPPELVELLQRSTNRLILKLFLKRSKSENEENGEHEERVAAKHRQTTVTVAYKFKASLDSLLCTLRSTNVHYIRCIKPNSKCEPGIFDRRMVLSQLNACGVVETIRISAAGFPIRLSHHEFLRRYSLLLRNHASLTPTHVTRHQIYPSFKSPAYPQFSPGDRRRRRSSRRTRRSCYDHTKFICQSILEVVQCHDGEGKENLPSKESTGIKVGRTKIFLQDEEMEKLESIRNKCLAESVLTIQKCWRRYRKRTERKKTSAAVAIQSVLRGWVARKKFEKVRQAATVIQRCARRYIREKRLRQLHQAVKDQIMPTAEISSDIPESTVEPLQYGLVAESSQRDLTYSFDTPSTVSGLDLLKARINSARPGSSVCTYNDKTNTFHQTSGNPSPLDFMSILACLSQHKRFCERTNAWNNLGTAAQFINRSSKIASRRHIETIPIAFHCRGTPLPYANTRPTRGCNINTGLADIGELYCDTLYSEDLD